MTYDPDLKHFPNPKPPAKPGKAPKVVKSHCTILQKIHGDEFVGYPATSSAQRIGVLCEIAEKHEAEYVFRTMVRLGLVVKGDIRNTVKGNAVKHLPPRAGKYKLPKWDFTPAVKGYVKRTYTVVVKEAKAQAKAAASEASEATS